MIIRDGFTTQVSLSFGGLGFPAEVPSTFELPHSVFFHDESDLSPVNENIDKVIYGLTKWEPEIKSVGTYPAGPNIVVQGQDYVEAADKMNSLFLKELWGDGLPIMPPTPQRVAWIMTGTDLAPDYILPGPGKVLEKGGTLAVESLAILLAMAGGRPEYLPVVLAIAEAITDPGWQLGGVTATTRSTFPAAIVSGTIGNQIRLNSGYGCLGPDPRHPANVSIGRAIRFMLQILGGAIAGIGTMSNFGGQRVTNVVVAEDEEGIPLAWPTLGEDRGFARGENAVTVDAIGNWYCHNMSTTGGGDAVTGSLLGMLPFLTCRGAQERDDPDRSNGFIMFPDGFAQLCDQAGWSKMDVKTWIYENCNRTTGENPLWSEGICRTWREPYAYNPEQVMLVVCGGAQAQHTYVMNSVTKRVERQSRAISLPKNWDDLLAQAEEDLGPNPGHTG